MMRVRFPQPKQTNKNKNMYKFNVIFLTSYHRKRVEMLMFGRSEVQLREWFKKNYLNAELLEVQILTKVK